MTVLWKQQLIRPLLPFAQRLRMLWWRVARPRIFGVKVIARNGTGALLLIRHSYQRPDLFMLPGGKIDRGETPAIAALRELREETCCHGDALALLGVLVDRSRGARNEIHLFTATTADVPRADGVEILEARFFAADALPANLSAATARRIAEWQTGTPPPERWED